MLKEMSQNGVPTLKTGNPTKLIKPTQVYMSAFSNPDESVSLGKTYSGVHLPNDFFEGNTPEEIAWITKKEDIPDGESLSGLSNKEQIMRILKLTSTEPVVESNETHNK